SGGGTTPRYRAVEERHSHQGQSGFTATPAASRSAAPWHHRLRTDAQIAWRLQEARSAPYSARQDQRGRKLVARRPLVRGGSSCGHAGARRHRLPFGRGHARWAALWQAPTENAYDQVVAILWIVSEIAIDVFGRF